jgi:hypothetical protein
MWGSYRPLLEDFLKLKWQTLEFIVSTHESFAMFGKNEVSQKIE